MQLFGLLNNMSKIMKDAGDEHYSNMLKHICDEYAGITISSEKQQIMDAYCEGVNDLDNIEEGSNIDWIGYYNKTYGNAN